MNIQPDRSAKAKELAARIQKTPDDARYLSLFKIEPALSKPDLASDLTSALAELAKQSGIDAVSMDREVSSKTARWLAIELLHKDMAYSDILILPRPKAVELAEDFMRYIAGKGSYYEINDQCRYFINGVTWHDAPSIYSLNGRQEIGWGTSVTGATFDSCIVVVGCQRAGVMWGMDED